MSSGRVRSSTTSSVRSAIDSRQAPLALNGSSATTTEWTRNQQDDMLINSSSSYASQHTLKTIRGPSSPTERQEFDRELNQRGRPMHANTGDDDISSIKRGNPQFIIDLGGDSYTTNSVPVTRARSDTFGGVELPQAPSLQAQPTSISSSKFETFIRVQQRPSLNRQDTDTSLSSLPSSLRLGGGTGDTFSERRPILASALKALALFLLCLLGLYITLHALLPPLDDEHRDKVKMPRSFADLKELNEVLQVYKDRNYARVLGCYVTVYLFIQAFSIPGSMYLSILGGAMYGVLMAMPLVCFCVATGALICYYISALLGPAILLNSEKWQARVDAWSDRVSSHRENLISYLIVIRIAPLPPHWLVNVVAPHLGISVWVFWISTFFGIAGVSYIHTTIGTTLDQMTSSSDFNLISVKNGVGLCGIVVAVLVPVVLRRVYSKDLEQAAQDSAEEAGPRTGPRQSISLGDDDEDGAGDFAEGRGSSEGDRLLRGQGHDRPFRLDSPGSSDDEADGRDGAYGRDDRDDDDDGRLERSAWALAGQSGNLDKASRLLGVKVEGGPPRSVTASGSGTARGQEADDGPAHDDNENNHTWTSTGSGTGNSPDRVW